MTPATDPVSDDLVDRGEAAFAEGQLELAEGLFRRALERDGAHGRALNNLAVICHQQGRADEAERLLLKAAVIGDDPIDALVNLSSIARASGRAGEAARYLERGLQHGESAPLMQEMGCLTEDLGDWDSARGLFRKARALAERPTVPYLAAFTELDLTPDRPVELQGYFGPPRKTERVFSRLKMQFLWLEDAYGTRSLFVGADIFGFGPELIRIMRARALEWGIDSTTLVCNASHTHYGPGTVAHAVPGLGVFDALFAQRLVDRFTAALPGLYGARRPATLAWGRAAGQIGFNRRRKVGDAVEMAPDPEGHYEVETPFLRVELDDGRRLLMVNHGCHPTGSGPAAVISADYPGAMRDRLVEGGHADTVMFLQGAAGDIKQGVQQGQRFGWIGRPEDAHTLGTRLADAVAAALGDLTPIVGAINGGTAPVPVPLRGGPTGTASIDRPENAGVSRAMLQNWAAVVDAKYGAEPPDRLTLELGVLSIGEVAFVIVPGEPMALTARKMRLLTTRHDVTFVLGYTNGLQAYLPSDDMVGEGGYEGYVSHFVYCLPSALAPGTESTVLNATRQIGTVVAPPLDLQPAPPLSTTPQRAFFVMSTGRSGTQTLSALLDMADNAKTWHHPQPYMIQETLHAYWDAIDRRSTFWAGRAKFLRGAWDAGLIHGETDHNMTPFCDVIAEDLPEARFLILVRDPREFVRSGMRRGYYRAQGAWEQGRLRPRDDDPRREAFLNKPQFEQVCWLWAETHRHIERLRDAIGKARVMTVRFRDLIAGPATARRVFDFLGLTGFDPDRARAVLERKLNAQSVGDFPHPSKWPAELHDRCWTELGDVAQRFGYARRYGKKR